jgi:hypothetical protein
MKTENKEKDFRLYECGICCCFHPWNWDGDCRDDANQYADPSIYAKQLGINESQIEILTMQERIDADLDDDY